MARRTSAIGMTPSFSPSMGSEKRLNASRMSASSCAEMLFSLASLDCRALGALLLVAVVSAGGRRRGGWRRRVRKLAADVVRDRMVGYVFVFYHDVDSGVIYVYVGGRHCTNIPLYVSSSDAELRGLEGSGLERDSCGGSPGFC
jgi:hypothetical protein